MTILASLARAAIGVVVETPIAVAADLVTLVGTLNGHDRSYTTEAVSRVVRNVSDATHPRDES